MQKLGGHAAENGEAQAHDTLTMEAEAATEAANTDLAEQPMPAPQNGALDTEVAGATDVVMSEPEEIAKAL